MTLQLAIENAVKAEATSAGGLTDGASRAGAGTPRKDAGGCRGMEEHPPEPAQSNFAQHTGPISRLIFVQLPEGLRLISSSRDGTVKYWDVPRPFVPKDESVSETQVR